MFQNIDDNHWIVKSTSGLVTDGYTVSRKSVTCSECIASQDRCKYPECRILCRHMYTCDDRCYDYGNGHICKHIHRVHSLQYHQQQGSDEAQDQDFQPVPVYYPPTEEPTEDTTTSHGKHLIYNDIDQLCINTFKTIIYIYKLLIHL